MPPLAAHDWCLGRNTTKRSPNGYCERVGSAQEVHGAPRKCPSVQPTSKAAEQKTSKMRFFVAGKIQKNLTVPGTHVPREKPLDTRTVAW
jgi:hypothetical protein